MIKELGFEDSFFDQKFSYLMDYKNISTDISEKSVLDFHLSNITNEKFNYTPNDDTPEFIWKYLSYYNLRNVNNNLENDKKISTIEKATHNENYSEADLLIYIQDFNLVLNNFEMSKILIKFYQTMKVNIYIKN